MITFMHGDLLASKAEALVNAVNTVGVMGKGIALLFKQRFPENYKIYAVACKRGEVRTGRMFVTERARLDGPRWIVNFPTKADWRSPSRLEWIEEGLKDLRRVVQENEIRSIAIPALGAGNGGLDWRDVRPRIELLFAGMPEIDAMVYEPMDQAAPESQYRDQRIVRGSRVG